MPSQLIHGACPHDCPDTCGVVTEVDNGRAVAFRGDPDHPVTRGWLCAKVRPYLDHVYHPDRLLHPLRRVGPKGSGQWERIGWPDAIGLIGEQWKTIISKYGAEAILPYSYSGTLGLVQMTVSSARLWARMGASQLQRSICGAAAETAVEATLGKRWSVPYEEVLHSKLVILWGHNPVSTAPHFMPHLRQAQHQGCQVVVIDPRRTQTARSADWHLAPIPGSDGALAMGIANILVTERLHDEAWLNAHSIGWPLYRDRIAEFPLARVAELTGLSEHEIMKLARLYAACKPGVIRIADGINRNHNGGQNVRAICALPAVTGQYGVLGGGLGYSTSGYLQWAVHHWDECPKPGRTVNMCRLGAALTGEVTNPPVMSLYVFGANPATSSPNAGKIVEGLRRADLFTVVHDLFLTDTADYADLVLPATSQLEHTDLHKSYGHTLLTYNRPAIPPLGESKSNWEVMSLLAAAMGFREPWLHQTADEVIAEVLAATAKQYPSVGGITLETLKQNGAVPLNVEASTPYTGGRFPTTSGKIELYSQRFADSGADPLPGRFDFTDDASSSDNGKFDPSKSLRLITGAAHHFVSSSLANQQGLLDRAGSPFVEVHPADAASRGIANGDRVVLFNGRGACQLRAVVTDGVRPGVVVSPKGRWAKRSGGSNVNWLTTDALADIAGQSTFHSTRVWLRRAE